MQALYSTFDPIQSELNRFLAVEERADSRADAIDQRADAIATNPTRDQFSDVFCGMGCGKGEIEKLRAAWLNGQQAFMTEVLRQMNAGFAEVATLEIDEADEAAALACDAREVLHDWE
jgi:hypothetical protein